MANLSPSDFLALLPALRETPTGSLWSSYDAAADVLYINFKRPAKATDSDLTEDDIIMRYEDGELVGVTILHASKR